MGIDSSENRHHRYFRDDQTQLEGLRQRWVYNKTKAALRRYTRRWSRFNIHSKGCDTTPNVANDKESAEDSSNPRREKQADIYEWNKKAHHHALLPRRSISI